MIPVDRETLCGIGKRLEMHDLHGSLGPLLLKSGNPTYLS